MNLKRLKPTDEVSDYPDFHNENAETIEQEFSDKVKTPVPENAIFTDTVYDDTILKDDINNHKNDKDNPHRVTKTQIGLESVLNIEQAPKVHTHEIEDVLELEGELKRLNDKNKYFGYDEELGEYINIDKYWDSQKNGKIYTSEFYHFDVTPNPAGVKKDDNIGLEVIPSTATEANRDDYDKIGLFKSIDVNAYVDKDGDYHVTAIKGDGRFKNDGTNGDVYVMSMVGYQKRYSDDEVWGISYSDTMHPEFEPLHEAVKIDGSIRPYLLHAKYIAGINPEDGYLASISGVPADYVMSHNHQITKFRQKGSQYSGKTSHDDYYVQLMLWLKYATTHSQSVLYGATSAYYLQYDNRVEEVHVKRVIVTNAQANNLLVGSTVSIGDYAGDTKTADRNAARTYNVANRVNITNIEDIGGGNSAVYVDSETAFDTTLTTTITTYPYNSGYCDSVLGRDGSPVNPLSGKEPFVINGIEMMIGAYEVLNNFIIQNNAADDRTDVYVIYDCTKYHTSITANYDLVGQILTTDNVWKYISKLDMPKGHPSVLLPIEGEASSSMGFADGVYSNPTATGGTRQWLSLGYLSNGGSTGLRALSASIGLGYSYWSILGRLSATGQSRRLEG